MHFSKCITEFVEKKGKMENELNRQNNSGPEQSESKAIRRKSGSIILPEKTRQDLHEVLLALGISQKKLSKEAGVSEALVSYLIKGTIPVRDPVRVSKLTEVLGLRLQQKVDRHLIGEEEARGVAEILESVRNIYGMAPSPEEAARRTGIATVMRNYLSAIFEQNNLLGESIKDSLKGPSFPGMQNQISAAFDMVNTFNQAAETFLTKHGDIFLTPGSKLDAGPIEPTKVPKAVNKDTKGAI